MIYIAHRGNTKGPDPHRENNPTYLQSALDSGYDVEVDAWVIGGKLYLGHDAPVYDMKDDMNLLEDTHVWWHAKNLGALEFLIDRNCHVFSHDTDPHVLTSKGVIWAFPGSSLSAKTVAVMPERVASQSRAEWEACVGVCSDFVHNFRYESIM
jgi:hypothetical protein